QLLQGNTATADASLAALQKDFPNVPAVLNLVAAQQLARKQPALARASYAKAAALAPDNVEALEGLVRMDVAAGRPKDAIDRISAALERTSGTGPTGDLLVFAARTYLSVGQIDRTEALLKQALAREPAHLDAYQMLGQIYAGQRRLDDAVAAFQKVAEQD